MRSPAPARRAVVDLADLRVAGGLMLAAAAARPLLPPGAGVPCPLRSLTGVPCPLCGMTTSVTAVVQLDLAAAIAANAFGIVAVVLALLLLARPRWRQVSLPRWLVPATLAAMWLAQLIRFDVL